MALLQGLFTQEGINKAIEAENNEGFRIRPSSFAVAETAGALVDTRDGASVEPIWYQGPISSFIPITGEDGSKYIQVNCNVPAQSSDVPRYTRELYLYALDHVTNEQYLLALSQPSTELTYDPDGEFRLRMNIKINNSNLETLFEFLYTQATEINDHNQDPNAHPHIRTAMNKAGIYLNPNSNKFNGQSYDGYPAISPSVTHRDAVYFDLVNNRYERAIVDGTEKGQGIGFYDAPNNVVVYGGIIDYPHSQQPFTVFYLSSTTAGGITTAPTGAVMGHALPNNKIFVGSTNENVGNTTNFDGDVLINLKPVVIKELTLEDDDGVKWDVEVSNEGLLHTIPYSIRELDTIFKIPKIDLSAGQLKVKTNGELIVVPADPNSVTDEFYYLEADNGIAWKLTLNINNEIITQAHLNQFAIQSEDATHFKVMQTDTKHALTYIQYYDAESLPAEPPFVFGAVPFTFYYDGTDSKPIYFSNGWKYLADNTLVV